MSTLLVPVYFFRKVFKSTGILKKNEFYVFILSVRCILFQSKLGINWKVDSNHDLKSF